MGRVKPPNVRKAEMLSQRDVEAKTMVTVVVVGQANVETISCRCPGGSSCRITVI